MNRFWPSLLHSGEYLEQFITPIIKAFSTKETKTFYTLTEYGIQPTLSLFLYLFFMYKDMWRNTLQPNEISKWRIKYYKGLGTSTSQEAKEYFTDLERHRIRFKVIILYSSAFSLLLVG